MLKVCQATHSVLVRVSVADIRCAMCAISCAIPCAIKSLISKAGAACAPYSHVGARACRCARVRVRAGAPAHMRPRDAGDARGAHANAGAGCVAQRLAHRCRHMAQRRDRARARQYFNIGFLERSSSSSMGNRTWGAMASLRHACLGRQPRATAGETLFRFSRRNYNTTRARGGKSQSLSSTRVRG